MLAEPGGHWEQQTSLGFAFRLIVGGSSDNLTPEAPANPAAAPLRLLVGLNGVDDTGGMLSKVSYTNSSQLMDGIVELNFSDEESLNAAFAALNANSDVAWVEQDQVYSLQQMSNDPAFPWGMKQIGAPLAWDTTTGSPGTIVAVIDSGIDYRHPDLKANMWVNPGEIPGNGKDDDGNGYKDDIHGYDFIMNDPDPMDGMGHGTHVAGTIAAVGNNGIGVVGVNWNAQLMALRIFNSQGTTNTSAIVRALDYAYRNGATISNNSWGGGSASAAIRDAITRARNAGHIFVAAAGNNGRNNDVVPFHPASTNLDNVVAVAATTSLDRLAYFSNYGATTVDLAAPGVNVWSTWPRNDYNFMHGTSMAAPHVTGAMALLRSARPDWSYRQIIDQVLTTTDSISGLQGRVATGGRLNAGRALTTAAHGDLNDQLSEAIPLRGLRKVPTRFTGSIDNSTDVDMYRFQASKGKRVTIDLDQPRSNLNSYLRLFDSTGRELARNDNRPAPGEKPSLESFLRFKFTSAGTYFIGVSSNANSNYNPSTGDGDTPGSTGPYVMNIRLFTP